MDLISFVLENITGAVYYKEKFPQWTGDHNDNVTCPFGFKHSKGKDGKPDLSVNINNTGGAYCHACGSKAGSIVHFEKLVTTEEIDDEQAASQIYNRLVRPIMAHPDGAYNCLFPFTIALEGSPKNFRTLLNDLYITKETVETFNLGWDAKQHRVTIPVIDKFGQVVNIRKYQLRSMRNGGEFPKIINTDGYGKPAAMFPQSDLYSLCSGRDKPAVVYWFSGESDTLLGWDKGIPSFCYTTGEMVCKSEWMDEIRGLHATIGVVQDNDEPNKEGVRIGEVAAKKRVDALLAAGVDAFLVVLPESIQNEKVKDFSDFIFHGGEVTDFLNLGDTKNDDIPRQSDSDSQEKEEGGYLKIPKIFDPLKQDALGEFQVSEIGRNPLLLDKPIITKAIVSGKLDRTYSIPHIIKVGDHTYRIPISRELLQLVGNNDDQIIKLIHKWLGNRSRVIFLDRITVTEVEIIPMIQIGVDIQFVNQKCYFFGPLIECNKPYLMGLIPTTHMTTQETVGMIVEVEPVSNILDTYSFNDESYELLKSEFHIPSDADSFVALRELAHSVAVNHTHIYNRDDLHLCSLLSWLSPLQFDFPREGRKRGWLNTLVLGDTETGKSEVCQALTKLFHCGVFINAESCSFVGLVGGAIKSTSGMFILRWGKIPLYNRQLVVVEELSGLTTQEISYMSAMRSEGVARYDKAGLTGETQARTRLICLSNVRGQGKSIEDYNTGVQAAQDLIGQNEDLARFDMILTCTDDEVESKIINKDRLKDKDPDYSERELGAFKELIMFAWSLKPEQIDFTVSAYRACLTETMRLCTEYHSSIPVFKAGSGRFKLARLAVAIATVQFAWDNVAKKLVVTDRHVLAAAKILDMLFKKPSFGYFRFSKIQYNLQKVKEEEQVILKIKEVFKAREEEFYGYVSNSVAFSKYELGEVFNVHPFFVERVLSQMFLSHMLKKGEMRGEWQLTKAGRKWLDKKVSEFSKL